MFGMKCPDADRYSLITKFSNTGIELSNDETKPNVSSEYDKIIFATLQVNVIKYQLCVLKENKNIVLRCTYNKNNL